ncbi:hypothetical protein KPH14_011499 [Odynerus spinipes]|uniref:Endonuclease/exonuclease/phosphatase domain-containing protein n=1 Tax=Odynerus spinipes TaxID=1348599 RepID=A0AAD9RDY3_9HYME|nr:hypothetical protein KPH14_011499 [Odynerus spinipes]
MKLLEELKPDIVLLNETKLNNKHRIEFKDYRVYRNDREQNANGGGTAILIQNNINCNEIFIHDREILETTTVKIKLTSNEKIFIVAAYAPGNNKKAFNQEFIDLFKTLNLEDPNNFFIIAGDLNAKHPNWKNSIHNQRGSFLYKWINENCVTYRTKLLGTEVPSYPAGNSYLDICIYDERLQVINCTDNGNISSIIYDSDHNAMCIQISINNRNDLQIIAEPDSHRYNYNKTDWQQFQLHLSTKKKISIANNKNLDNNEIESYIQQIDQNIYSAIKKFTPKIKKQNITKTYHNQQIEILLKLKHDTLTLLRKEQHRNNYTDNETIMDLKALLNSIKKETEMQFTKVANEYWKNKIKSISRNNDMFPSINAVLKKNRQVESKSFTCQKMILYSPGLA